MTTDPYPAQLARVRLLAHDDWGVSHADGEVLRAVLARLDAVETSLLAIADRDIRDHDDYRAAFNWCVARAQRAVKGTDEPAAREP